MKNDIKNYIKKNINFINIKVISDGKNLLGTGGAIKKSIEILKNYFFATMLCGFRFPMFPLSFPEAGSITAFTRVGFPDSIALLTARYNSSGLVT